MRQYAGFGIGGETNKRYRFLLEQGQTGLSVAFDLPTQMGHDPDASIARGEVGKVGVSIATVEDMADLFEAIPLERVSTSMTINATAAILLALYVAVGRRQGVAPDTPERHRPERHPQGIHRAGHLHLPARAVDAADHRRLRVVPRRTCRAGTPSRSPATTSARRAAPRCRRWPSRWPTVSPTCRRRSTPASTWTRSRRSCRSSSTRTTTCWRRSPSSARRGGCGPASCAIASRPAIRAR